MWQMNEQLKLEEEGLCGKRGLEPNSERQTFEVEVPAKFREQYEDVVRPLRGMQQQRRNMPNNSMGKLVSYPWIRDKDEDTLGIWNQKIGEMKCSRRATRIPL